MRVIAVYTGHRASKEPGGSIVPPFVPYVCSRERFAKADPTRHKTLAEYNAWLHELTRDQLQAMIKRRREHTGEDLKARGTDKELREQLAYDIEAWIEERLGDEADPTATLPDEEAA